MTNLIKTYYLKARKSEFIQDSFWALVGNVIAKGMSLGGTILVARFLGKEVYGEYGTIKSTLVNIAIFSTFGLGYTATKYIAEYKNKNPEFLRTIASYTMKISFSVSGLIAVLVLVFTDFIAIEILEAPHLTTSLKLVAVWIIFNSLTTAQIGILSGFNAFKALASINLYVGVIAFTSSVVFTYYWNLTGALSALLLTQTVNWLLNYREVLNHLPEKGKEKTDRAFLMKMLNFSLPVAMQEGLYSLSSWLMILLLIKLSNYGELGLYSAAVQWSAVVLFIPGILRNVILTHLSSAVGNEEFHDRVLKKTILISFVSTFIPFLIIYFFRDWVVLMYGESFRDGLESVLSISLFTVIFVSISNVFTQVYLSKGKNWAMFAFRIVRDSIILVLAWYLITSEMFNGANALALSNLISNVIFTFLISSFYYLILNKKNNYPYQNNTN